MAASRTATVATLLYVVILAGFCTFAFFTRVSDVWDILAYSANVEAQHNTDFLVIHRYAYQELAKHETPAEYQLLTAGSHFRQVIAADPVLFGQYLPYYSIRPVYIMALNALRAFNISPVIGARIVAALSLFGIGLIAFFWVRRHSSPWLAMATSSLLLLCYPVLLMGRARVPDGMSALFVFLGLYLLIEHSRAFAGVLLLLASIWVRTDNVILVGCVLAMLVFAQDKRVRLKPLYALVLMGVAGGSVLAINHFSGNYGYASLFHNQFVSQLDPPNDPSSVSLALYFHALRSDLGVPNIFRGFAFPFGILAIVALFRARSLMRDMVGATVFASIAHFVIFPYFTERLFTAAYLVFWAGAITTLNLPFVFSHTSETPDDKPELEVVRIEPVGRQDHRPRLRL